MTKVYVSPKYFSGMKYHTDRDCPHIREGSKEWDIERAEVRNLELCQTCSGERTPNSANHSIYRAAVEVGKNND